MWVTTVSPPPIRTSRRLTSGSIPVIKSAIVRCVADLLKVTAHLGTKPVSLDQRAEGRGQSSLLGDKGRVLELARRPISIDTAVCEHKTGKCKRP